MPPLPPGRRLRGRRLLVLILATLFWVFVAEGGYRVYRALSGETYHAAAADARLDALIDELHGAQFLPAAAKTDFGKGGLAIHPYEGYQIAWLTHTGLDDVHYFASQEGQDNFDIVLIGGSVAAQFGNYSGQSLIPALQADPRLAGRKIRMHSVACPGHKQPQHAMTLQWLLSLGWKPDAVILLDGFNELAVSADNAAAGVNPLFPSWSEMQIRLGSAISDPQDMEFVGRVIAAREESEDLRERLGRWPLTWSAIAGTWAERTLERSVGRVRGRLADLEQHEAGKQKELHSMTIGGPDFDKDPAAVQASCIEAWREGSRSMQAACRARGIPFLHVLQPAAADAGSKPLTPEEAEAAKKPPLWAEAVSRGYPRLREVGAQLASEGVNFLDATQVFAGHGERIYRDGCHFESEGCAILGPLVAQALLKAWK